MVSSDLCVQNSDMSTHITPQGTYTSNLHSHLCPGGEGHLACQIYVRFLILLRLALWAPVTTIIVFLNFQLTCWRINNFLKVKIFISKINTVENRQWLCVRILTTDLVVSTLKGVRKNTSEDCRMSVRDCYNVTLWAASFTKWRALSDSHYNFAVWIAPPYLKNNAQFNYYLTKICVHSLDFVNRFSEAYFD